MQPKIRDRCRYVELKDSGGVSHPLISCSDKYDDSLENEKLRMRIYLNYEQIPHFRKGNVYVQKGYRPKLSTNACIKSLCWWNNESVNIWSHAFGLMLFCLMMFYDVMFVLPSFHVSAYDLIIHVILIFSFQICMLFSACYHLFNCISEAAHSSWLCLDLCGVLFSFTAIFLSGISFAFDCCWTLRWIYSPIIVVLFVIVLYFVWHPNFDSPDISRLRLIIFFLWSLSGLIPTFHWIILKNGFASDEVKHLLPNVFVMYILSGAAFFFYSTKIPERLYPGKFDFIGSSHQIWHILIVAALCWWHHTGLKFMAYRTAHQCRNINGCF
ncbi:PAQR3 (predicted) [Pycnogonum litorale]